MSSFCAGILVKVIRLVNLAQLCAIWNLCIFAVRIGMGTKREIVFRKMETVDLTVKYQHLIKQMRYVIHHRNA